MLTALRASDAILADTLAGIAIRPLEDRAAAFDGTLIKALLAWIVAHPDQASALLLWVLSLFGVVVPPTPAPTPPTPVIG